MNKINQMYKKVNKMMQPQNLNRGKKPVNFCCSTCKMDALKRFKPFSENN